MLEWEMNDGSALSVSCEYTGVDWGDGVNECLTKPCDTNAVCNDKIEGFTCTCLHGFTGDGFNCTLIPDIDECIVGSHDCSPNANCIDTLESFVCICQEGFVDVVGDGRECTPQSTCCKKFHMGVEPAMAQYNAICNYERDHSDGFMEYRCVQDPDYSQSSYWSFPIGIQYVSFRKQYYILSGDLQPESSGSWSYKGKFLEQDQSLMCPDLNRYDTGGSWPLTFECREFVKPDPINECADDLHQCHVDAVCTDTDVAYTCECKPGWHGDGFSCIELINECDDGTDNCHANAFCTDTIQSYGCICEEGFTGDGFNCTQVDVNECEDGTHDCQQHCSNTLGSYTCTCNPGLTPDQSDVTVCIDLDECEADDSACSQDNTFCINFYAGFMCKCNFGFVQNTLTGECVDVDECATATDNCGDGTVCTNSFGAYSCDVDTVQDLCEDVACDSGMQCMSESGQCADIDECESNSHTCQSFEVCSNSVGSFSCNFNYSENCPPTKYPVQWKGVSHFTYLI